jgi:hypothetical protein
VESASSHQSGSRAIAGQHTATLNYSVNHGTLQVKQLLGLESSMANPDLAAPNAAILPNRRFSCPFAGRQAQLQPVAEIVQCGEPVFSRICGHSISRPIFTLPFSESIHPGFSSALTRSGCSHWQVR